MMRSIEKAPPAVLSAVKYIMFDVDDTVTNNGKLTEAAYGAMWALSEAGYALIPVTGRPAGWCDMMLREWPVLAVICENGAFATYWKNGSVYTLTHPNAAPDPSAVLAALKARVLLKVRGARTARDQSFRIYDVAFDFAEDEPHLDGETVSAIMAECAAAGAKCKLSSIHVNAWFGDYDKLSMAKLYFREVCGLADARGAVLFFGDSPNDEPMFSYFPLSCGVENVTDIPMEHMPAYTVSGRGGYGFAHAANILLDISKKGD